MVEKGQLRYVLGLASAGLVALGGALAIESLEYWGATGTLITLTIADMVKHRNN